MNSKLATEILVKAARDYGLARITYANATDQEDYRFLSACVNMRLLELGRAAEQFTKIEAAESGLGKQP